MKKRMTHEDIERLNNIIDTIMVTEPIETVLYLLSWVIASENCNNDITFRPRSCGLERDVELYDMKNKIQEFAKEFYLFDILDVIRDITEDLERHSSLKPGMVVIDNNGNKYIVEETFADGTVSLVGLVNKEKHDPKVRWSQFEQSVEKAVKIKKDDDWIPGRDYVGKDGW